MLRSCLLPISQILIVIAHLNIFNNVSTKRPAYDIVHKINEIVKHSDVEASFLNLFSL